MGVYIKGMTKPSDCQYCVMYRDGYCGAKGGYCCKPKGVDDDCPLVEVKTPHGRLIDVQVMEDLINEQGLIKRSWNTCADVALNKTSTVIEAEVE